MLIYSILFILLSNAVSLRRDKSILYSRTGIIILIYCLVVNYENYNYFMLEKEIGIYSGLFHVTTITHTTHLFIFMVTVVVMMLTAFHPRKLWSPVFSNFKYTVFYKVYVHNTNITNKMGQQFKIIEYPLILLFILTGALLLISSSDIISTFLSIELQSYGLYLLSTIYRDSELSTSAGITYFLLGGLSSCFILLGTSLLYANYGTTHLDHYYVLNTICNYSYDFSDTYMIHKPFYLNASLLIMTIGFLFKISAAPFHFWSPDVYDNVPTIVTTFVAIIAKISILIFLFSFTFYTNSVSDIYNFNWKFALLLSSLLSLVIGSILGLSQARIKRLFAYSTISHMGFMLLAISITSLESIEAFTFYLIQYTISNLNAFFILITIGYSLYLYISNKSLENKMKDLQDKNYSPIQLVSQLQGYYNINPTLSLSLTITLFSFVGIPPLIGFFAKQMVLSAALDSNYIFLSLVAILTSVISAFYYLNIIKQIYFDENVYNINKDMAKINYNATIKPFYSDLSMKNVTLTSHNITLSSSYTIVISILTLTLLMFIFDPSTLLNTVLIMGLSVLTN